MNKKLTQQEIFDELAQQSRRIRRRESARSFLRTGVRFIKRRERKESSK